MAHEGRTIGLCINLLYYHFGNGDFPLQGCQKKNLSMQENPRTCQEILGARTIDDRTFEGGSK